MQALTLYCGMGNTVHTVILEVHSMTTRCQRCLGRRHDPEQVSLVSCEWDHVKCTYGHLTHAHWALLCIATDIEGTDN